MEEKVFFFFYHWNFVLLGHHRLLVVRTNRQHNEAGAQANGQNRQSNNKRHARRDPSPAAHVSFFSLQSEIPSGRNYRIIPSESSDSNSFFHWRSLHFAAACSVPAAFGRLCRFAGYSHDSWRLIDILLFRLSDCRMKRNMAANRQLFSPLPPPDCHCCTHLPSPLLIRSFLFVIDGRIVELGNWRLAKTQQRGPPTHAGVCHCAIFQFNCVISNDDKGPKNSRSGCGLKTDETVPEPLNSKKFEY